MNGQDIDPDMVMIVAGFVFSLIAAVELYPAWKQARNDTRGPSARGDDGSVADA